MPLARRRVKDSDATLCGHVCAALEISDFSAIVLVDVEMWGRKLPLSAAQCGERRCIRNFARRETGAGLSQIPNITMSGIVCRPFNRIWINFRRISESFVRLAPFGGRGLRLFLAANV
jgi:hypothetical protein